MSAEPTALAYFGSAAGTDSSPTTEKYYVDSGAQSEVALDTLAAHLAALCGRG